MSFVKNIPLSRWALMFFALMAFASVLFPFSPVLAQDGTALDYVSNFFSPDKESMQAVYNNNFKILSDAGCWGCNIFDIFSSSVFSSGRAVAQASSANLISVIVAVASLFSLFYIGSSFVAGDASDLLSRWKVFWNLMIAVTVGSAILASNSFDFAWNFVYNPLIQIPLGVAEAVPQYAVSTNNCGNFSAPADMPSGAGRVMSEMREVICGGHNITIKGMAFGMSLATTGDGLVQFFINVIVGILIMIIFLWVAISFPLRFIDVLLRLTVVGVATPILVVCAVFKPTRGYVQIGISNVLYAGCLFAFTSIMFNLGGRFFDQAVENRIGNGKLTDTGMSLHLSESITLIAAAVIFSALLKMAPALASEFSQFRGQTGGGAGDAATSFAATTVSLPVKAAAAGGATVVAGRMAGGSIAKGMAGNGAGAAAGSAASSLGKGISGSN